MKKAFTLIELVIGIAIVTVLMLIVVFVFRSSNNKKTSINQVTQEVSKSC